MFSIKPFYLLFVLLFCYLLLVAEYYLWSAIGVTFSVALFINFLNQLGKKMPIRELIVLIAAAQWIVGAKLSYLAGKVHYRYYMYVDEETYMSYVVPATLLFAVGLFFFKVNNQLSRIEELFTKNHATLKVHAISLLSLGILSTLVSKAIAIPALAFFLFLLSLLTYVGIIYFFYLFPSKKWLIFFSALAYFFVSSLSIGMFHDLLLIGVFFSFFIIDRKTSLLKKVIFFSLSFFLAYMIQVVKGDFRKQLWDSDQAISPTTVFYNLVVDEFFPSTTSYSRSNSGLNEEEESADANTRLNQGWIISRVMSNIPSYRPYLGGSTISEALEASFIPRFLSPNKKGANSALENFNEITGLQLQEGTSMGLSLVGEFYANYGRIGGMVALFIYGFILSLIIQLFFNRFADGSPIALIFLIVLFYQVVKAETDFIKVINHLVKSFVVVYLVKVLFSVFNNTLFYKQEKSDRINLPITK